MKIDVSKDDLMTLRSLSHEMFDYLRRSPANHNPNMQECVRPQMKILAKFIRKLNVALKKCHGHSCNSSFYNLDLEP